MDYEVSRLEYFKDEKNKKIIQADLDQFNNTNIDTQLEIARHGIVNSKYSNHYVNVAGTVMMKQDAMITELENQNQYLVFENNEFKKQHGALDTKLIQQYEASRKLVPLDKSSKRLNDMLAQADQELRKKL